METLKVATPTVVVVYEGKDISAHVSPALVELTYVDFMEGESDSVDMALEDAERRWQDAWYPQHGDVVQVQLGFAGEPLLPCGEFEVDEVELEGPPDVIRIKALAAGVKRSVRTRNGRAYENTTLGDVAKTVAQRNKLKLTGTIEPVKIARVTQVYETDLIFLKRVAASYGYAFSVRGDKLCFFKRSELKAAEPTLVIRRQDVTSYHFRDKVRGVVTAATASYHDPKTKQVKKATVQDAQAKGNQHSADELKLNVRAENEQQARLKADAALDVANEDQTGGSLTMPGQVKLMAGVNVKLEGFGKMDGKYTVTQARHRVSRNSGYGTEVDVKRVRDPKQGATT
ncbi:phage late control D family protein [Pseudomonas aeruginosa]|uniref:phage late control D family protein n=1 Tax=Pseudomonas aeruginosa TaxID=287 RepID=UPI0009356709|nr:contractile injection system protein, VgrG/Pvc8 family [Pseudomonas aeruginosa]